MCTTIPISRHGKVELLEATRHMVSWNEDSAVRVLWRGFRLWGDMQEVKGGIKAEISIISLLKQPFKVSAKDQDYCQQHTSHKHTKTSSPGTWPEMILSFEAKYAPNLPYCSWMPVGCICLAPATQLIAEWFEIWDSHGQSQHICEAKKSHPYLTWSKEAQEDVQVQQ